MVKIYQSLHKVDGIICFSCLINGSVKHVQFIITKYDCVKSHVRTFDMSICQTFFNHKNLFTRYLYKHLTFNKVNVLCKENVDLFSDIKYFKRIYKYSSRGFKPYFDIQNNKMFNLEIAEKEILKISNIEAETHYFNLKKLLEWEKGAVIPLSELNNRKILSYYRQKPNVMLYPDSICNVVLRKDSIGQDAYCLDFSNMNCYYFQVVYLVDENYNILFIKESLQYFIKVMTGFSLVPSNVEHIKDEVVYLGQIEGKIKTFLKDNVFDCL